MITLRVYGILINENKQVLVSDEFIRGHYYTKFPGGGLEFGEGTRDCLKREFKEEMDLSVAVEDPCVGGVPVGAIHVGIREPRGRGIRETTRRARVVELPLVGEHRDERDERAHLQILGATRLRGVESLSQRARGLGLHTQMILHVALDEQRLAHERLMADRAGTLHERRSLRERLLVSARVGSHAHLTHLATESIDRRSFIGVGGERLHGRQRRDVREAAPLRPR